MSLDGLRAWIGEVERKLGMRTRVFLVLAVLAVGGAGAAVYLAVDAHDNAVSEGDVQALQEQLEARIDEGSGAPASAELERLEAEVKALQSEVEQLGGKGGGASSSKGAGGTGDRSAEGGINSAQVEDLVRKAKEAAEAARGK